MATALNNLSANKPLSIPSHSKSHGLMLSSVKETCFLMQFSWCCLRSPHGQETTFTPISAPICQLPYKACQNSLMWFSRKYWNQIHMTLLATKRQCPLTNTVHQCLLVPHQQFRRILYGFANVKCPSLYTFATKDRDTMKSSLSLKDFQLYFPLFFFLVGLKEAKVENVLRLIKNMFFLPWRFFPVWEIMCCDSK